MIKIGEYNKLKIDRRTTVGLFLVDGEDNDVLLPNKYVYDEMKVGDEIEVFVYLDSNERIVCTTLRPKIELNTFAYLKSKQKTHFGIFMDWGLEKDLLVPFREQAHEMEAGKWYVVYLYLDKQTNRLAGSTRVSRHLKEDHEFVENQEVQILVTGKTDAGWNAIINNEFRGLIYENEIFETIEPGDIKCAYIKKIREDRKIDLSLQKQGYESTDSMKVKIVDLLVQNGGILPYSDKSTPAEISEFFEMSKKTFKKAIGSLYREKIIKIEEYRISLNEED